MHNTGGCHLADCTCGNTSPSMLCSFVVLRPRAPAVYKLNDVKKEAAYSGNRIGLQSLSFVMLSPFGWLHDSTEHMSELVGAHVTSWVE